MSMSANELQLLFFSFAFCFPFLLSFPGTVGWFFALLGYQFFIRGLVRRYIEG